MKNVDYGRVRINEFSGGEGGREELKEEEEWKQGGVWEDVNDVPVRHNMRGLDGVVVLVVVVLERKGGSVCKEAEEETEWVNKRKVGVDERERKSWVKSLIVNTDVGF